MGDTRLHNLEQLQGFAPLCSIRLRIWLPVFPGGQYVLACIHKSQDYTNPKARGKHQHTNGN